MEFTLTEKAQINQVTPNEKKEFDKMTRNTANYWIDLLIFILMLVCFVSGIVIWVWPKNRPAHMGGAMPMPTPAVTAPADTPNTVSPPIEAPQTKTSGKDSAHPAKPSSVPTQEISGNSRQHAHGGHSGQGNSKTFLGLTRRQWKWLHIWPSVAVLGPFLILHLLMHLKWCVKTTRHLFGFSKKTA